MMTMPPYFIGATLLFWGWQIGQLEIAAAFAVLLELPRHLETRFEFSVVDCQRIADLVTVLFIVFAAWLVASTGVSAGVFGAIQWLPAALVPLMAAQVYGRDERLPASALIRTLRAARRRDARIRDWPVDFSWPFAGTMLVTAGVANHPGLSYFAGVALLAAWALADAQRRAGRLRTAPFAAMLVCALALGHAGHVGLSLLQDEVEMRLTRWWLGRQADASETATRFGHLGELKGSDAIDLRLHAPREAMVPGLVLRAAYNRYAGGTWFAQGAAMRDIASDEDGLTWRLAPPAGGATQTLELSARAGRRRTLLPLPAGATRLERLPAAAVARNTLGTVEVTIEGRWVRAGVAHEPGRAHAGAPERDDLLLPAAERSLLEARAAALGLDATRPLEAIGRLREYFADYRYTTWGAGAPAEDALARFLEDTRAGHCEHFATATVLLLRAAGIPARYATGWAVMEWSALEEAWIARAKHGHAWTLVWADGRWQELDTTPGGWLGIEEDEDPSWLRPVADLARWLAFRIATAEDGEDTDRLWLALVGALVLVLGWRLVTARNAVRRRRDPAAYACAGARGLDSEFYALERALAAHITPRPPAQTMHDWFARIAGRLDTGTRDAVARLLALHARLRFDPQGLDEGERRALAEEAVRLAARLRG